MARPPFGGIDRFVRSASVRRSLRHAALQSSFRLRDLVVVPPDMAKYKAVSREVFTIFGRRGHPVEGLSMDEAFIDFGPMDLEPARKLAQTIRDEVYAATLLTVSGGVATGKMIAKIASDFCKPNGLMAIVPGEEAAFLAPMPVGRLWGIGPKRSGVC